MVLVRVVVVVMVVTNTCPGGAWWWTAVATVISGYGNGADGIRTWVLQFTGS